MRDAYACHTGPPPADRPINHPYIEMNDLLFLLLNLLFLLLVLLFPRGLHYRGRDTVKITLAILGDAASTVVGLLEDTNLLERLADLALDGRGAVCVVRWAVAAAVAATVELRQGADTDVLAEVDVAGNGRCVTPGGLR